jgi:hypothetical protein
MPILLRIILQRLFAGVLSVLAFVGITPEVTIPTELEAQVATEERKEIVVNILGEPELPNIPNIIKETTGNIDISSVIPFINQTEPEETSTLFPYSDTEDAVVNILCINREVNKINLYHGSGVIISENGVVITNAHVAQNFLLKDTPTKDYMDCTIRKENIPTFGYTAELLYISPEWVETNYKLYTSLNPRGTGEDDFAFLHITGNTNPALSLQTKFPHISVNTDETVVEGDVIRVAGYPGSTTGVFELDSNAKLEVEITTVRELFTFNNGSADIFSTNPTSVAKQGSSGGGIFKENRMVGLIVTTSPGDEGNNLINALTTSYIDKTLRNTTNISIANLISGNLVSKSSVFNSTTAPRLSRLLSSQIK